MRYIIRTLRFKDGDLDPPGEAGWANWRVVERLNYHEARPSDPRVEYIRCLVEDRT